MRREADGSIMEVDEDSVQRVSPLLGFGWHGGGALPTAPGGWQCPGRIRPGAAPLLRPSSQTGWVQGTGVPVGSGTARATTAELEGALTLFLQTNPPSLDYAEDLAALINLNECSAMNTLQQRYQSRLPYTYAGTSLVAIGPSFPASSSSGKVRRGDRGAARIFHGKWSPTPVGTVAEGAGRCGADRWHRGTVTARGRDAQGMLGAGGCSEDTQDQGCSGLGRLGAGKDRG